MSYPIRLSEKELVILRLLRKEADLYGLELVAASDGALKRGTVYVVLARMQEKGLVASHAPPPGERTPGLPRPRYRISDVGRRQLESTEKWLTQVHDAPGGSGARVLKGGVA